MNAEDRIEQLVKRLRENNHRITPQRLTMLKLLVEDEGHPSAIQIYEQMKTQFPMTSLATVYKTLHVLKEMGEIQEIGFSDGDNRYDIIKTFPHIHLICVQCRSITDAGICKVDDMHNEIETTYGFKVMNQRMDFFGICPECQRSMPA